jgi:hypothetical protein
MAKEYKGLFQMPSSYIYHWWPYLTTSNYELKSQPTADYNCVSWAQRIDYKEIDLSLDAEGEPLVYPDLSCLTYIEHFEKEGFILCESPEFEEGFEKIALYERAGKTFEHVARQLGPDLWTSKLGYWEDIEHTTLEVLESQNKYGVPTWFMKKAI